MSARLALRGLVCCFAVAVLHTPGRSAIQLATNATLIQGTDIIAYVISKDDSRWRHAEQVLSSSGLRATRGFPVPLEKSLEMLSSYNISPERDAIVRLGSLMLSMRAVADLIATHPDIPGDGFGLVFEDDVALNEAVRPEDVADIIKVTAASSADLGFFSLGMCSPSCSRLDSATYRGVLVARCNGVCAHAYGLHKRTAGTFWKDVMKRVLDHCNSGRHCDQTFLVGPDVQIATAFGLNPPFKWPLLVGANLTDHEQGGMTKDTGTGLFYQANSKFPARMWTEPAQL